MPKGRKLGSNCKKNNDCKNNNCVDGQCTHKSKGVSRPRKSSSGIDNELGSAFSTTGDFFSNVGQGTTAALTGLTTGVASYMPSFSSSQPEEKDNTYDDYDDNDETESIPESVPEELADMIREGSIKILMINGERYYMNTGNGIIYSEAGDVVGEELENGENTVSPQPEMSAYGSVSPDTAAAATGLAALGTAYDTYDKVDNVSDNAESLSNTVSSILDEEPLNTSEVPDSGSGETIHIGSDSSDSNVQKYSDETPSPEVQSMPTYDGSVSPDNVYNDDTVSALDYTDNTIPESAKFMSSVEDNTNMLPPPSLDELNESPAPSLEEFNESPYDTRNRGGKSRRKYKKATKKRKGRKNKNTRRKRRGSRRR